MKRTLLIIITSVAMMLLDNHKIIYSQLYRYPIPIMHNTIPIVIRVFTCEMVWSVICDYNHIPSSSIEHVLSSESFMNIPSN